jgi:rhodanese-related sulfurtransferase
MESVHAVAAQERIPMDSAFVAADLAYEVNFPMVLSLFMSHKKNNTNFIDARDPELYAAGHIPGATNIPFEMINQYSDSVKQFPKSDLQVLYCDGGDCHLSHDLAELMLSQGWSRIAVYIGGWEEWFEETDFIETAAQAGS